MDFYLRGPSAGTPYSDLIFVCKTAGDAVRLNAPLRSALDDIIGVKISLANPKEGEHHLVVSFEGEVPDAEDIVEKLQYVHTVHEAGSRVYIPGNSPASGMYMPRTINA